ncbi:MAG TPA: biopolymer transporter ExbD [Kiritimatiellae bacterium]|nr:biopolymer transporter ExbD [Kiritimatiellia bacterium]
MARCTTLTSLREISEINMTPLMDLTFLLLITFIITFPLIEQGVRVDLPRVNGQELDPRKARTISIDRQGRLYLDDRPVDIAALREKMRALGKTGAAVTVLVRADERIAYGRVMEIMRVLRKAGISRIALVTQPENPKGR